MSDKLRACPANHAQGASKRRRSVGAYWQVVCNEENCGWAVTGDTEAEAVAAWNCRPVEDALVKALETAMQCDVCEGKKTLLFPPQCNCYGDDICTHKETEGECPACDGTGLRDIPEGVAALRLAKGE